MGLRELKKQQTRQLIAETAWRLFAERGFDRVTVAEVAREARVAEATVFNYFPAKEDLFSGRFSAFSDRLIEAVSRREEGEPVLHAVRRYILGRRGLVDLVAEGDSAALDNVRTLNRVIAESTALQAREGREIARTTEMLAQLLASETGAPPGDPTAHAVANALVGVHQALITYARQRIMANEAVGRLVADLQKAGKEAFALLERGLGGYARKGSKDKGSTG
jgi:AcrR family transcriptional regulator